MTPVRGPYPGLRPFERTESALFFGRDDCIADMAARLEKTRFLAVLGSSGTGKSSLVKCGLLAHLEDEESSTARWRVVEFRPGGDVFGKLAEGLLKSDRDDDQHVSPPQAEIDRLKQRFEREGPRELIRWCSENHLAEGTRLLLVVDQFEELFRYQNSGQRDAAQAFVFLLLESRWPRGVANPQEARFPIFVTLTMRSEYLGACALMLGLAEAINEGAYLTPRMTREQCEEAIVGPALVCGVDIEGRLANKLLNDMADFAPFEERREDKDQSNRLARQADQLPLMQYALNQMWRRAVEAAQSDKDMSRRAMETGQPDKSPGSTSKIQLRFSDYLGLETELDRNGDRIFNSLSKEQGAAAEIVFRAVTSGTTTANATRHPTQYGELVEICGQGSGDAVAAVIDKFGGDDCQFLTSDSRNEQGRLLNDSWIDITHESLIRQWQRLSKWLECEGRAAQEWRRLKETAERGDSLSWRGLLDARKLRIAEPPTSSKRRFFSINILEHLRSLLSKLTPAWAERFGADFDRVIGQIKKLRVTNLSLSSKRRFFSIDILEHSLNPLGTPTPAWAERYGGDFDRVTRLVKKSIWLRLSMALFVVLLAGNVLWGKYDAYIDGQKALHNAQMAAIASTQALLDYVLSQLLPRGDITTLGAQQVLQFAKSVIDQQIPRIAPQPDAIAALIRLGCTAADLNGELGNYDDARNAAKTAKDLAETLLASNPNSPEALELLFQATWHVGDAISARGADPATLNAAFAEYSRAEQLARQLLAKTPNDPKRRESLVFVLQKIGDVYESRHQLDKASDQYQNALTLVQKNLDKDPKSWDGRRILANTMVRIGQIFAEKPDFDPAMAQYRAALDIRTKLADEKPDNYVIRSNLVTSHRLVATSLMQRGNPGDLESASSEYQQALGILEKLYLRDPNNATWESSLAQVREGMAELLRKTGNPEGALEQDREAYKFRDTLAYRDPTNPSRQRRLATVGISIAGLLTDLAKSSSDTAAQKQKFDEAIKRYRDAITTLDELNPRPDDVVFDCYIGIGDVFSIRTELDSALKEYNTASAIALGLAASNPDNVKWQRKLAISYSKIADTLVAQQSTHEAVDAYRKALEIATAMAQRYPDQQEWRSMSDLLKPKIAALASSP